MMILIWLGFLLSICLLPDQAISGAPGSCRPCGIAQNQCGAKEKIFGDVRNNVAGQTEFPWMAALTIVPQLLKTYAPYCGGTAIGKRWILTAAHCIHDEILNLMVKRLGISVSKKDIVVVLGMHNWRLVDQGHETTWVKYNVVEAFIPPEFRDQQDQQTTWNRKFDIGLLQLDSDILSVRSIGPACLPKTPIDYSGKQGTTTGWGRTGEPGELHVQSKSEVLRKAELTVYPKNVCDKAYLAYTSKDPKIFEYQMCANPLDNQPPQGNCAGDSGGPLLYKNEADEIVVIGVVSWAGTIWDTVGKAPSQAPVTNKCSDRNNPMVYTRVSYFLDWIKGIINHNGGFKKSSKIEETLGICPQKGVCDICGKTETECLTNIGEQEIWLERFEDSLYYFNTKKSISWSDAEESCQKMFGTTLAAIHTSNEYEWIKDQIIKKEMVMTTIGARRTNTGSWVWTDGSTPTPDQLFDDTLLETQSLWYPNKPTIKDSEDYLQFWYYKGNFGLADVIEGYGQKNRGYICRIYCPSSVPTTKPPPTTTPSTSGGCSKIKTSMQDSRLQKDQEIIYYFVTTNKLPWIKAEKFCISEYGGHLASINSEEEYKWLKKKIISRNMRGPISIGGEWITKKFKRFEWIDESDMDMKVLNANWYSTRGKRFPSYQNKRRNKLELWYTRKDFGFANVFEHNKPTMFICKVVGCSM